MNREQLYNEIIAKRSFLCIGLDTDIDKIPVHLLKTEDPIFEFNKAVIDATACYCVSYKPNLAFYEAYNVVGMNSYHKTVEYIKSNYPEILIIADAKRGDIGNTSQMYAKSFFETGKADAVTLSPYMGYDTVEPFLQYKDKWAVILALTSNVSASDFEMQKMQNGDYLYELVLKCSKEWGSTDNMMYVVGATKAEMLKRIRTIIPDHFLLVPGVGAQGGSLSEVAKYGMNDRCGLLVNSSRAIIYADNSESFARVAALKAKEMVAEMDVLLNTYLKSL